MEYHLSDDLGFSAGYLGQEEEYRRRNRGQDHTIHRVFLTPNYYLVKSKDRLSMVSATLDYVDKNARNRFRSYEAPGISASWFARWPMKVETYARLGYSDRSYNGKHAFLYPTKKRRDKRTQVTLTASKNIHKNFHVTTSYAFTDNNSNLGLWNYDRHVFGISLGADIDL